MKGSRRVAVSKAPSATLPPNPKYDLWHQNQDAVKWANEYRESGRYAADQAATNRRWVEYWEPKLDAAKTDDEIDQIFAAAEAESRHRFPDMERVDDIAKSYGLNEPSPTIPPREWYRRLAGEVEARNVQTRRDMTPSQRRATRRGRRRTFQTLNKSSDTYRASNDRPIRPPRTASRVSADPRR